MTEKHKVSEAEFDRVFASGPFGARVDPRVESALREAGFDEDQVKRGVRLWESGAYFDFADLASSLAGGAFSGGFGPDNRRIAPRVTESSIARAGKRLEEQQRGDAS